MNRLSRAHGEHGTKPLADTAEAKAEAPDSDRPGDAESGEKPWEMTEEWLTQTRRMLAGM